MQVALILPQIVLVVRSFDEFSTDNDPYHEHDFRALEERGERLF
jgi:hypothetical protein